MGFLFAATVLQSRDMRNFLRNLFSSFAYAAYKIVQGNTILVALFTVTLLSWIAVFASARSNELKVHFFDVGQGDAIFLELPDKRQILIDGGPNDKVLEKLNDVMPFWDRSIDIMVATHADADHLTGLVPVLAHYNVGAIIWNGLAAQTKTFQEFKEAMDSEGAEVLVGRCCMRFIVSDVAFFEVLYPFTGGSDPPLFRRQNNYSLVIRFVYGKDSFLFTGDIERQVEYQIVQQKFNLKSDVLKIPHHGSKTSSSELFLAAVQPKVAVISVGGRNTYGHPHEAVLQRLEDYDIEVRRTDEGDIRFNF